MTSQCSEIRTRARTRRSALRLSAGSLALGASAAWTGAARATGAPTRTAAPAVVVWTPFAADRGIRVHVRGLSGESLYDEGSLAPSLAVQAAGAIPAGGNLLTQPLWFRMTLAVDRWTFAASTDGRNWITLGIPETADFVGAWIGVFATSHSADSTVRAVFDHLSGFAPSTRVRVGAP